MDLFATSLVKLVLNCAHSLQSPTVIYYGLASWMLTIAVYFAIVEHENKPSIGIFAGKYKRFLINAKFAWVTQEAPALLCSAYYLCTYWEGMPLQNRVALLLFVLHYFNRTLVYPWQLHSSKPIFIAYWIMAIIFCAINGVQQGNGLSHMVTGATEWSSLPVHFWCGVVLFVAGAAGNVHADRVMERMRETSQQQQHSSQSKACDSKVYRVPQEGLYKYIVAANYFSEAVEWWGYFLASDFSLCALAFAVFTTITLWSRAIHKHCEYKKKDPEAMISRDGTIKRPFIPFVDFERLIGYNL